LPSTRGQIQHHHGNPLAMGNGTWRAPEVSAAAREKRLSESIVPCGGESGLLVTERWTTDDEPWYRRT
jgi:hypothetical protein